MRVEYQFQVELWSRPDGVLCFCTYSENKRCALRSVWILKETKERKSTSTMLCVLKCVMWLGAS